MLGSEAIALHSNANALNLAGPQDNNLKLVGRLTGARVTVRGDELWTTGTESQRQRVKALVDLLSPLWQQGSAVTEVDVALVHFRCVRPSERARRGLPLIFLYS
ncbi:MAG: hypothetical protein AAGE92_06925, partial [Cyanobacteria bacterium P01_G01_bin.4]